MRQDPRDEVSGDAGQGREQDPGTKVHLDVQGLQGPPRALKGLGVRDFCAREAWQARASARIPGDQNSGCGEQTEVAGGRVYQGKEPSKGSWVKVRW